VKIAISSSASARSGRSALDPTSSAGSELQPEVRFIRFFNHRPQLGNEVSPGLLGVVLTAIVTGAPQASSTAGSIVGCVSDIMNQRLPGAGVVAKSGGVERTAVADNSGCYELKDLPPAPRTE
jgi:hypothetical protein